MKLLAAMVVACLAAAGAYGLGHDDGRSHERHRPPFAYRGRKWCARCGRDLARPEEPPE